MAALTEVSPGIPEPAGTLITEYNDTAATPPIVLTANMPVQVANNDGRVFIGIRRTGTAAVDMTVDVPIRVGGLEVAQLTNALSTTSGAYREYGPFDPTVFNEDDGALFFEFDAVTDVELTVTRRP